MNVFSPIVSHRGEHTHASHKNTLMWEILLSCTGHHLQAQNVECLLEESTSNPWQVL
jgi:hypothetical protein